MSSPADAHKKRRHCPAINRSECAIHSHMPSLRMPSYFLDTDRLQHQFTTGSELLSLLSSPLSRLGLLPPYKTDPFSLTRSVCDLQSGLRQLFDCRGQLL